MRFDTHANRAACSGYVWVQTITGVMLTAAATAVMLAIGLNNVLFWAVIFFLLTFIPNIGVTVGSIAPSLFALVQFKTIWQAITHLPGHPGGRDDRRQFDLPQAAGAHAEHRPVATLLSLAFWSWLWGLPGAFLAVLMTLMAMMVFAQFPSMRWVAAMLSNDGMPVFRRNGEKAADEK